MFSIASGNCRYLRYDGKTRPESLEANLSQVHPVQEDIPVLGSLH